MNEIGRKGYEMYDEGGFVQKLFRAPKFTEEEEELRTEKWDNISSYISEMEQKWILGVQDVDADWDAYIKRLDEMGMKEVTEIYNTAWKRQNEMLKKAK